MGRSTGLYLDGPLAFSETMIPIIANNYIRHNVGGEGGGIYFHQAIAGLINDVIADNQATQHGAGMYLYASSPQVFHNTVAQNIGDAGIYLTHQPGSIWPPVLPIPSRPSFTNTVIVSHTIGVYVFSTGLPSPFENRAALEGTLWNGNGSDSGGPGLVTRISDVIGAPRFTCTGSPPNCLLPYHVLTDSAAVDAGVPVALKLPGTDLMVDIDGQVRPSGKGYDIGADEVVSETYSVWLIPSLSILPAEPGQTITHTHFLVNAGTQTDTYTLTAHSSTGWATPLITLPIELAAQTRVTVPVRVLVPLSATSGVSDTTILTVTSAHDARAGALDVTGVVTGAMGDLLVKKWADRTQVGSGETVHFTVAITGTGSLSGTVQVTDTIVPTEALSLWSLPPHCSGVAATGEITCEWTLPQGVTPFTRTFQVTVTTSGVYTGVLINTVRIGSTGLGVDSDPSNNISRAMVGISAGVPGGRVYLPLVMRDH